VKQKLRAPWASGRQLTNVGKQEDHGRMEPFAARRLKTLAENTRGIWRVEILSAVQGLDFRNR